MTGRDLPAEQIATSAQAGDADADATLGRYVDRLARGLAHVINVVDPDIVVFGGGLSNVERLYQELPERLPRWVFGGEVTTPVVPAAHGDASGVRGAAWLWPRDAEPQPETD